MSQPIILIMTYGRNLYDHNADIEHEVRYEQPSKDDATMEMYITHAKRTYAHARVAWFAMNELNVVTGENKQLFYEAKPLQQRLEVNVAAKAAKTTKKVNIWAPPQPTGFFSATEIPLPSAPQSTASILAQIAAMQANQDSLASSTDHPEMSNDF